MWLQTKANIVYDSKTCQPEFILCINHLIGGTEGGGVIVASEQINPVLLPVAIETIVKVDETSKKRKKTDTIVLEERTKLLKASAHESRGAAHIKTEPGLAVDCGEKPAGKLVGKKVIGKKTCQCYDDVDCEHINFQDCPPVAWDMNEEVLQQQQWYEELVCEHYGFTNTPPASPPLVEQEQKTETIDEGDTSTSDDSEAVKEKVAPVSDDDDDDIDLSERAPFIPLVDAELMINDEILAEIEFMDSPICPPSWLDEDSQSSVGEKGRARAVPPCLSERRSVAFSAATRKLCPPSGKKSNFIELVSGRGSFFPAVTRFDMEVNAPVQSCKLLQGEDLLSALDQGMGEASPKYY